MGKISEEEAMGCSESFILCFIIEHFKDLLRKE